MSKASEGRRTFHRSVRCLRRSVLVMFVWCVCVIVRSLSDLCESYRVLLNFARSCVNCLGSRGGELSLAGRRSFDSLKISWIGASSLFCVPLIRLEHSMRSMRSEINETRARAIYHVMDLKSSGADPPP
jgi:hypothetical protein